MAEREPGRKQKEDKRKGQRRRYLSEEEFRKLLKEGKITPDDRRAWEERRKQEKKD